MTMLEKMAQAIDPDAWDENAEPIWASGRKFKAKQKARDALRAIREPDKSICGAIASEAYSDSGAYTRWQAGVDAILLGGA